jgi:hypothetical protein
VYKDVKTCEACPIDHGPGWASHVLCVYFALERGGGIHPVQTEVIVFFRNMKAILQLLLFLI